MKGEYIQDRYAVIEFRGRPFYLDTVAFSPRPTDFCAGPVVEKGLDWIGKCAKPQVSVLDFCSGQGCVGLSLFEETKGRVGRMGYVDVNYFNLLAWRRRSRNCAISAPRTRPGTSRYCPTSSNACLPGTATTLS